MTSGFRAHHSKNPRPSQPKSFAKRREKAALVQAWLVASDFSLQDFLEHVPVAMRFILGAMAHQSHGLALGQFLEQAQREFLAEVLNDSVALINCPAFEQFLAVAATELAPTDYAGQHGAKERLARAEVRHPDIAAGGRHPAAAKAGGQNAQAILAALNR